MVDSGASHMLLPLKALSKDDKEHANRINVKLAVGDRTAYMFRDEVYAATFWKNVAKDGFEGFLNGIDEYENHSARS
eukprot:3374241-Amphidinium_carterae.1